MLKIAGLWKTDKSIHGRIDKAVPAIGGMRLVVIPNKERTGRQPHYLAFLSFDEDKEEPAEDADISTPF